jgi:hypothetical protein
MRQFTVILALLTLAGFVLQTPTARAADIDDFNAAVEQAAAHGRTAIGYLRSENMDLADVEIDRMGAAWSRVATRFGAARPAAFADSARFGTVLTDVSTRLVAAAMFVKANRPDNARDSLLGVRDELSALRREAKATVLADCILDANAAMDALYVFDSQKPDWNNAAQVKDLEQKTAAYTTTLQRCNAMAPAAVRQDPQFRRVVDGAFKSLRFVLTAVEMRDGDLLHRVLIELRSFDNLLAFSYG